MNKRIRLLAEQANIHFSRVGILDGDPNGSARMVGYSKMEKFAELILKDLVSDFNANMANQEDDVDYGLHLAIEIINKNYGVEL